MSIISTGIQAGTSLFNSILGARTSRKNTAATIAANKEMAEYSYGKNLEMWHRQNEYNLPTAQMQRFKEAGLNPNLIYGQGGPGNATNMPNYQAPRLDVKRKAVQLPNVVGMHQDIKMKNAQVDLLQKDVELKGQDIINRKIQSGLYLEGVRKGKLQNDLLENAFKYSLQGKELDVGKKRKQLENMMKDLEVKDESIKGKREIRMNQEMRNKMLREYGITPGDNVMYRLLMQLLEYGRTGQSPILN